jgi:hypothetical protein
MWAAAGTRRAWSKQPSLAEHYYKQHVMPGSGLEWLKQRRASGELLQRPGTRHHAWSPSSIACMCVDARRIKAGERCRLRVCECAPPCPWPDVSATRSRGGSARMPDTNDGPCWSEAPQQLRVNCSSSSGSPPHVPCALPMAGVAVTNMKFVF